MGGEILNDFSRRRASMIARERGRAQWIAAGVRPEDIVDVPEDPAGLGVRSAHASQIISELEARELWAEFVGLPDCLRPAEFTLDDVIMRDEARRKGQL